MILSLPGSVALWRLGLPKGPGWVLDNIRKETIDRRLGMEVQGGISAKEIWGLEKGINHVAL